MNIINTIEPIKIDIYNIRNERQKINNELAIKRIRERNLTKDINNQEYKRILSELLIYNKLKKIY